MRPCIRYITLLVLAGSLMINAAWAAAQMLPGWTIVDEGNKEGPSAWSISAGLITQWSNIYDNFGSGTDPAKPGTYALTGDLNWTDYTIRAEVRSTDNDAIGIIFRYQDPQNYYRFSMDTQRSYRRLIKKVQGNVIVLAEDAEAYARDRWYALRIAVKGIRIQIFVDEGVLFDVGDDSLSQGKFGLYCWGNAGSEFKNILVESDAGVLFSSLDLQSPIVTIETPTSSGFYETHQAFLDLSGSASDDVAVSAVAWENAPGDTGLAVGTSNWTIPAIPLLEGENEIKITATDAAGNKGIQILNVTYRPAPEPVIKKQDIAVAETQKEMPAIPVLPGQDYVIDPGDVLEISVWKDEALSKVVTVLPDGKFAFPLIGEIVARGKTVLQLQNELAAKITAFVPEPVVTVVVQQAASMLIYVIGKVNSPGRFSLNADVDVLQVLAIAGGFNPFAKRNKVKIFRRSGDKTDIFEFKYDEVSKGNKLEQNIKLRKGDVIVVP